MNLALLFLLILSFISASLGQPGNGSMQIDPDGVEIDLCQTDLFEEIWNFEEGDNKILASMKTCKASLLRLTQLNFGPPSAYEVMNAMCKGACSHYMGRYRRMVEVQNVTQCDCMKLHPRCPRAPTDILCDLTGLCYDAEYYWKSVCEPDSCGRWVKDEDTYRTIRNKCQMSFDGATSTTLSFVIVVFFLTAVSQLL